MKPVLLNVGATWETDQLDRINQLNQETQDTKVVEVYGSLGGWATARSQDRIPPWNIQVFNDYLEKAKEYGIDLKWTMNFSCLGKIDDFDWRSYKFLIKQLKKRGVHKYIVAVPLLIGLIKEEDPDALIEISTINRVTSVKEIAELCKMGASSFCWDVMMNRDFDFLSMAADTVNKYGAEVELIVNEFCTFMCPHRNICYNLSSHSSGRKVFNGYPFKNCIELREREPWQWVAARFILPSDLVAYQDKVGINRFKITGRTHSTDELMRVLGYYMRREDPENLLDLWHHINILVGDSVSPPSQLFISTGALRERNFLSRFTRAGTRCNLFECGRDCVYCSNAYEKAILGTRP